MYAEHAAAIRRTWQRKRCVEDKGRVRLLQNFNEPRTGEGLDGGMRIGESFEDREVMSCRSGQRMKNPATIEI
jgi:hypothetical protein